MSNYTVYILRCKDGSLYTGITTDLERRVREHRAGTASKYTTSRGVDRVVHTEEDFDRSKALQREAQIKVLSRAEKLILSGS